LEAILEWLTAVRLGIDSLAAVIICGDFNARAGRLLSDLAWDTTEDSRGRQMVSTLGSAGFTHFPMVNAGSGRVFPATFFAADAPVSQLDYVWASTGHRMPLEG
jgi:endonuclease/exonuclease/phosphatase family metal-dependent hydrolase